MELFIIRDGQQTGPFSEDSVQSLLKQGGLRPDDMGWHKGLPAWLPLSEVLQPGTQRPSQPPPVGAANSGLRPRPASARQKALLQFIGVPFSEKTTREDAGVAISDALENPKLTGRLAKWGDEKLRLHPDLFQDELDYRRANRISRYLELCQTEGAEVVKDITKAHVQVLMESLDKRQVGWDTDPRSALWDYLLPTVSEHFPQLVQEEWKGKLRFGGTSKVAAAYAGIPATGVLVPQPASNHLGAIRAALRGIIYGLMALGVVIGGFYLFRDNGRSDIARNNSKTPAAPGPAVKSEVASPAPAAEAPVAAPVADEAAHPTKAPLIGATPEPAPAPKAPETPSFADRMAAGNPGAPAAAPAPTAAVAPAVPAAAPAPAPAMAANGTFTPAPAPPGSETAPAQPAAALNTPAPAAGPAVRNSATLTQPVTVQLQFGKVTLNPGTRLRLLALEGANVRVNFNNNIVLVPVAATDIDPANTVVAAPPAAPTITAPAAPLPATAPTANATPPAVAPKSSPSSDL